MKLSDIGEIKLIEKIAESFPCASKKIIAGIGDDAAVLDLGGKNFILWTIDTLTEKVHFDLRYNTPYEIGYKLLGINISDITAMGGEAKYALLSLGLPPDIKYNFLKGFMKGIKKLSRQFSIKIIGGDTVSAGKISLTITLIGEVERKNLILRSGAKKGDLICVTGSLGGSAAYLSRKKFYFFKSRQKEIRLISRHIPISSMIDISDGLSTDLYNLTKAGKVGAIIEEKNIPVSPSARRIAKNLKKDPLGFALHGGEDFELLFTVRMKKEILEKKLKSLYNKTKMPVTIIGKIASNKNSVKVVKKNGRVVNLKSKGYEHFK
jgi:thiamine-monophosphate kinase